MADLAIRHWLTQFQLDACPHPLTDPPRPAPPLSLVSLQLALKAPFGGLADLASSGLSHQCYICAQAHAKIQRGRFAGAMESTVRINQQQIGALEDALTTKDKEVSTRR
jgi:hypothetical protein